MNPAKTEVIWFGSRTNLVKTNTMDLSLHIGNDKIQPVSFVRDLGIHLDEEMNMKRHVNMVSSTAFYHLRRLKLAR